MAHRVQRHLGVRPADYDARILTWIPGYAEMLDETARAIGLAGRSRPRVLELGVGTGALAARALQLWPGARWTGVDTDPGQLAVAAERVGDWLSLVQADFRRLRLPPSDAIVATLALHHVPTAPAKLRLFERCAAALPRGGVVVIGDCHVPVAGPCRKLGMERWRAHLVARCGRREADRLLAAWAKEDHYFPLDRELRLLADAGLHPDVLWRRAPFSVIAATRPRRSRVRHGAAGRPRPLG